MSDEDVAGGANPTKAETTVEEGEGAGVGGDTGRTDRDDAPSASAATVPDLGRFWIKVAGWMVMALGVLTILLALHWRAQYEDFTFPLMVGMIFSGISYVLAGQGLDQGYQWPFPLAAMACVFSPAPWLTIPAAVGFYKVAKHQLPSSALRQDITSKANLAYGLWVAGVSLVLYSAVTVSGGCGSWWSLLIRFH